MPQISVQKLFEDNQNKLQLVWVAGYSGAANQLTNDIIQKPTLALVGHLNFVHPNRVQVLGCAEMDYLRALEPANFQMAMKHLFTSEMAAMIVSNGEEVPMLLVEFCEHHKVPLFTSPDKSPYLMDVLRWYLSKALAVSTNLHGVFLGVLEVGVLITGESGMGKSELALELISRGHGLVADDNVEVFRIGPETLEGRCPDILRDFLEVRGLGVLNIRTIFGETAIRPQKSLKLIIHLVKATPENMRSFDRLHMNQQNQEILGVPVRKVVLPVAAGRNLAVLVETAVRNYILQLRGLDSSKEFIERHRAFMESQGEDH